MRRTALLCIVLAGLVAGPAMPAAAGWRGRIDRIVRGREMGVAVRLDGRILYERNARTKRVPASNEKLLLTMALFDHLAPSTRLVTRAGVPSVSGGTVKGNLFVLGSGDPAVAGGGSFAKSLPFKPTRLRLLARRIKGAGVERITGRVIGSTHYFSHDWFAPGWKSYYPQQYVPLASALTYNGNAHRGRHISDPELRAARALTKKLESIGVRVRRAPRAGAPRPGLEHIARVQSQPLRALVRYMNRRSSNFFAEVLGKRLGVARYGQPGTIAKAGAAIQSWANTHGVGVKAYDGSGLSYQNHVSPYGLVRLLGVAESEPWAGALQGSLPKGGQGTLEDRLRGTPVRAKTGTLTNVSALSGWVWMKRRDEWGTFSIMSRGMDKPHAVDIEDRIVKILNQRAR
jgi:D-alanyl-D-alanine carboxypeptidase/D-alanyl-D-alanine-endopeptidase (penicillin-binding protein 4)